MNPEEKSLPAFPRLGVRLSYFQNFINYCSVLHQSQGLPASLKGYSTTYFCETFVKPLTNATKTSLCELLVMQDSNLVGEANVFISHAWKYEFLDVVEALMDHFLLKDDGKDYIIWFDLFSNNQHQAVSLPFEWWCNTFKSAIAQFNHTVMILAPWNDPIPLTRAWCLWELYCTIETSSQFEVAMSRGQREQFFLDMGTNHEKAIFEMLSKVKSERSEAFKLEDQQRIHMAVKATVGFARVNEMIFEKMRGWVIESTERALKRTDLDEASWLGLALTLGILYESQSLHSRAVNILTIAYDKAKNLKHADDLLKLEIMTYLGHNFHMDGNHKDSIELLSAAVEGLTSKVGNKDPRALKAAYRLTDVYYNQQYFEKAIPSCESTYTLSKEVHGKEHEDTLQLFDLLTSIYRASGVEDQKSCAEMWAGGLEVAERCFGEDHPLTIKYAGNFALCLPSDSEMALNMLEKCFQQCKERYGLASVHTFVAMNHLALLFRSAGKYDKAIEIIELCLKTQQQSLGDNHTMTLNSLRNLSQFYAEVGRIDLAMPMFERCLTVHRQYRGNQHSETCEVLLNYASAYFSQKLYSKVEPLARECVNGLQELIAGTSYSSRHYLVMHARALNLFAITLVNLTKENLPAAKVMLEKSASTFIEVYGEQNPETQQILRNLLQIQDELKSHPDQQGVSPAAVTGETMYREGDKDKKKEDNPGILAYCCALTLCLPCTIGICCYTLCCASKPEETENKEKAESVDNTVSNVLQINSK